MRPGPGQPWLPLQAKEHYSVQPPGFVWAGTARLGPVAVARAQARRAGPHKTGRLHRVVLLGLQRQPRLARPGPHPALLAQPDHAGDRPAHHSGIAQVTADRLGQASEHLLGDRPGPARGHPRLQRLHVSPDQAGKRPVPGGLSTDPGQDGHPARAGSRLSVAAMVRSSTRSKSGEP